MHGACLCGAVSFEAEPSEPHCHACHCEMCRRWTGSALMAVPIAPGGLAIADASHVREYASSDWAARAFCDVCGSALYYRVTAEGPTKGATYLSLGLFDDPGALPLATEIYIDAKPASYDFAGERPRLTRAEAEAQMASGGS